MAKEFQIIVRFPASMVGIDNDQLSDAIYDRIKETIAQMNNEIVNNPESYDFIEVMWDEFPE